MNLSTLPIFVPIFVTEVALPSVPTVGEADEAVARGHSVVDLIIYAGPVVQLVLLLLAVMSVISWGIVIRKWWEVKDAKRSSNKFSDIFWESRNLPKIFDASQKLIASPVAVAYIAGYRELKHLMDSKESSEKSELGAIENVDRALKRAKAEEITRLERGTTFLATTASSAPFIGLFGTVWGIMHAFMGLSQVKSTSIQAVAPGISEALIATAIGLAAAIPAAIAYNYYMQQVRILTRQVDMFAAEFLNIARRYFLK